MISLHGAMTSSTQSVNMSWDTSSETVFLAITNKGKPKGESSKFLRSLVAKGGSLLCVGPPSSQEVTYPEFLNNKGRVEEIVDGTLISFFWYKGWRMSTRQCVGGSNSFPGSSSPFAQLVENILPKGPISDQFYGVLEDLRRAVPGKLCASFVLQHKSAEHRVPVKKDGLVLVNVFILNPEGKSLQSFSGNDLDRLASLLPESVVRPEQFSISTEADLDKLLNDTSRRIKGLFRYVDSANRVKVLSQWFAAATTAEGL